MDSRNGMSHVRRPSAPWGRPGGRGNAGAPPPDRRVGGSRGYPDSSRSPFARIPLSRSVRRSSASSQEISTQPGSSVRAFFGLVGRMGVLIGAGDALVALNRDPLRRHGFSSHLHLAASSFVSASYSKYASIRFLSWASA